MDWLRAIWRRCIASFSAVQARVRVPQLFRYQSAVLAGVVVLVIVVSVALIGGGSSSPKRSDSVAGNGISPPPSTPSTTANPSPTATVPTATVPTDAGPWRGTVRVTGNGEEVTKGPPRVPGLRFGLAVSGPQALVGSGNLVQWTAKDSSPTAAACLALLDAHAVYQVTIRVGDQVCIAALDGRTASAKVTDEGTGDDGTPYIELDVMAYSA